MRATLVEGVRGNRPKLQRPSCEDIRGRCESLRTQTKTRQGGGLELAAFVIVHFFFPENLTHLSPLPCYLLLYCSLNTGVGEVTGLYAPT